MTCGAYRVTYPDGESVTVLTEFAHLAAIQVARFMRGDTEWAHDRLPPGTFRMRAGVGTYCLNTGETYTVQIVQ